MRHIHVTRLLAALSIIAVACGGAVDVSALSADGLTEEWSCGYGFWVSNPQQTVSVQIAYLDDAAASRGEVPARVELPHPDWKATALMGRDLFANWCDDVIERGEPEPRVDTEWPIVGGTLELQGEVPDGMCAGASLTVEARDLVAESPGGGRLLIGDLEITNAAWGCFAG